MSEPEMKPAGTDYYEAAGRISREIASSKQGMMEIIECRNLNHCTDLHSFINGFCAGAAFAIREMLNGNLKLAVQEIDNVPENQELINRMDELFKEQRNAEENKKD